MNSLTDSLICGTFVLSGILLSIQTVTAQSPVTPIPDIQKEISDSVPVLPPMEGKKLTLSREECIRIAPTIKIADMEVKRTDYSKKENLAQLFPKIDFNGAYQRAIELQQISMNMGGESRKIKMGMDNTWNFGFSASMPLVAPTLWKSIKISDIQILQNHASTLSTM